MTEKSDISKYIDISKYNSILCLNGNLPSLDFFKSCKLPIIAADGAANRLNHMGVTPDFIIGDCDSVDSKLLEKVPHLKIFDQNYSDFQKANRYIKDNDLDPTIICGISGNYLDHIINNIGIFMLENPENIFMDDEIIGFSLYRKHEFNFPINSKISILGMPNCKISTGGLKWGLSNSELSFPGSNSCFNRNISPDISVNIHNGKCLMIVYRLPIDDAGVSKSSL